MDRLIYVLYLAATRCIGLLPLTFVFCAGAVLGWLAYWIAGPYRRLVLHNMGIAFAEEKTPRELRALARRHFKNLGANLLSSVKCAQMPSEKAVALIEFIGRDLQHAIMEKHGGFIPVCCHTANWELFTLMPLYVPGHKYGTLFQPLTNRFINADVRRSRERAGLVTFSRHDGFNAPIQFLREKGTVGVMVDQHAGDAGIWTPFFGRLASTSTLPAMMSLRSGAPLVPYTIETAGLARWRLVVGEPVPFVGRDVAATTAALNLAVEKALRRAPEDWFWVHNRWKTPRPKFLLSDYKRGVTLPAGMKESDLKPFRILIRASNWLGDAVMSVPAVRAIKAGRPDAHVTILTRAKLAGFWRREPGVDDVIEIGQGEGVFGVAKKIRGKFDAAVVLPNSIRTGLEVWLAGIPRRVGFSAPGRDRFLNQLTEKQREPGPPRHQSHDYLDLAEFIGAKVDRDLEKFTHGRHPERSEAQRNEVEDLQKKTRIGICPGAEYGPAKRWPAERFAQLAQKLGRHMDLECVLFGVGKDHPQGDLIAAELGDKCTNLIGKTSLDSLCDELSRCEMLITNDTGTMHLAAFLGVPVAAIFGSTEPALTGPLGRGHLILRRHAECAPCFLRECPIDFRCMNDVTVDFAARRILEKLAPFHSQSS